MKAKTLVLMFLSLTMSVSSWGYSFVYNGIYYNILSGNTSVEVTYGSSVSNSYSGSVTIPSSVSYSGKTYSVTSIGMDAFYNCKGLTSVTLPNSVTSIGDEAFKGCTGLTNVTIPNSVTSIGSSAFYGCTGLTAPLYNNTIFAYMPPSYSGSYTIPSGITKIAGGAFKNCTGLTSVTLPNSVTSIGDFAFFYCRGLTNVTLPNSVTSIGDFAFDGCTGLTAPLYNNTIFAYMPPSYSGSYTIPSGITTIAGGAFGYCRGLTSVTIPNGVTSIGLGAFQDCTGLTNVTIPNGVTSIGWSAFENCTGLTSVTIPNSVTSIGWSAFSNCTGLTSVYFKRSTPPAIGYNCFENANPTYYVPCGTTSAYQSRLGTTSTIVEYPGYIVTVLSSDTLLGTVAITQQPSCQQLTANIQAFAASHYHFVRWSDGNTDNPRCVTVASDTSLTAIFEGDLQTITATGTNGMVDGGGTYNYGSIVTLTATADEHYHFAKWSDGNTDNPRTIMVSGDDTFTAIFEIDRHTVSSNHDFVSGTGEYDYGTTVTLTAHSNEFGKFIRWEDGVLDSTRVFVLDRDTIMNAEYDLKSFVITATCEHGTVTGSGTYVYPDVVTLTVTPDEGYRFVKWSDENDYNPRIFVAREDLTVEAICEEAPIIDDVENVQTDAPAFYVIGTTVFNPSNVPLKVYSAAGKLLKSADTDIDLSSYPAGIYMVVDGRGNTIKMAIR